MQLNLGVSSTRVLFVKDSTIEVLDDRVANFRWQLGLTTRGGENEVRGRDLFVALRDINLGGQPNWRAVRRTMMIESDSG